MLTIALAVGCRHRTGGELSERPCEPTSQQSPAEVDLTQLNGSYAITFVATAGPKAGQVVRGRLVLHPQDSALVRVPSVDGNTVVTQPVIGTMDLATDEIGATRMGDLLATDATRPGVGVYVSSQRGGPVTGLVARVGSESNVRGQALFDGGYFTLFVGRVGPTGVRGGWASSAGPGGMMTDDARGHFCAEKLSA